MRKNKWLLGAIAFLGLPLAARATPSYQYVAVPEAPIANGSNAIDLYLQETLPSGSTYSIATDGGLYSGAVAVVEQAGGTGVSVTGGTNNTTSSPANTNFSTGTANNVVFNTSAAHVIDSLGNTNSTGGLVAPFSTSTVSGTTTNKYLLGTVTLNVSSGANATFKIESLFNANGDGLLDAGSTFNTLTNGGNDLDPNSTSSAYTGADSTTNTLTVNTASPVPEPASLAVFGFGAAGLIIRRRRARAA